MGEPSSGHTLERIDNAKGYYPENCKWVSRKQQAINRRKNRFLECDGQTKTLTEWSEVTGLDRRLITRRISRGWSVRRALFTPKKNFKHREDSYVVWRNIIKRCTDPSDENYANYGARGITVCKRWLNRYENFRQDMGQRPKGASLHRIDNDKGYTPENCKWTDVGLQSNNKRSNRYITYNGITQTLQQWSRKTGLRREMIARRLNSGWSVEKALSSPPIYARIYVEWHGKKMTWRELSEITDVPYNKIRKRLKRGWTLEEAVSKRKKRSIRS